MDENIPKIIVGDGKYEGAVSYANSVQKATINAEYVDCDIPSEKIYVVDKWGEGEFCSLWAISEDSGVSIEEIKKANPNIGADNVIHPGQEIIVPIVSSEVVNKDNNTTTASRVDNTYDDNEFIDLDTELETGVVTDVFEEIEEPIDVSNLSHEEFIEAIAPGAIRSFKEDGVLPSVTIAQAILETGWGKHSIGNNIFGIKGKGNFATTQEEVNGQLVTIKDSFRAYSSISDSIVDHGKLLTGERYASVIEACEKGDYKTACEQLQKCGYATDSSYPSKLISIIESNDLTRFDS